MPDRVGKMLKWLAGLALLTPVIMLLVGFGSPRASMAWWVALIVSILPISLIMAGMVGVLRQGFMGDAVYATVLVLLNFMAMTVAPHTGGIVEILVTRMTPIIGILAVVFFLREDLRYNLRPLWYSLQAMQDLQKTMATMRARKDAKKRGEDFDPSKVMDAEAIVRAVSAKTGRDIPAHMQGFNTRPGFRQEAKDKSKRKR
jgi:hypothetical protein